MAKTIPELKKLQRNQLLRWTKEDLIEIILTSPEQSNEQLSTLTTTLNEVISKVTDLKRIINSPDSAINKKFLDLQSQVDQQAQIIAKQQRFLEMLDRKERENNLVILGVPDGQESLDGKTTDKEKIEKIWLTIGAQEEVVFMRRLGDVN